MKHFIGLDISMKETSVCIIDNEGKIIKETTVKTEPKDIAKYIKSTKLMINTVALESGNLSHWLVRELKKLNVPIICVDARHIAAILSTTINKTDKNDARGIAQAVRCNMYREVHAKSTDAVDKNTHLVARRLIVDQRTNLTNAIRGILKAYGIKISANATTNAFFENVQVLISELEEDVQISIKELLNTAEILHNQVKRFNKMIIKLSKDDKEVKRLQTVPGIGPITAISFKAEIDDPYRFKKSRLVGAYLGMTPKQYSSGETSKQGRISKCGSKELRHLLMEAGFVVLTRSQKWSRLKIWGLRLMKKSGIKKAALAVGRKLAVIMHRMLVTGEDFYYAEEKLA